MKTGIVAGLADVATGIASLKAAGEPVKTSTTSPLRSVAQSPKEGAKRFKGCAVGGSVDSEMFLACRFVEMEKFDTVPSLLTVYPVEPLASIVKTFGPGPIGVSFKIESPE
jgi:hypothetical protein